MSRIAQRILFALPAAYAASLFVSAGVFAAPVATVKSVDGQVAATKPVEDQLVAPAVQLGALNIPATAAVPVIKTDASLVAKNEALSPDATEIKPSDWQYSALQGLVSKYDCNSTALGGQAVSRDSFVDGLNSCLKKVEPIVANNPSKVSSEELDTLRRLTQEFRAELSNIDTRVEKVQQRTALAQSSQFSTTTKLKGEVIVGLNGVISGGSNDNSNATVGSRARLLLESTFTGKDRLYTRLSAANAGGYGEYKGTLPVVGNSSIPFSAEGNQTYFGGINGSTTNGVGLDWLAYQFPLGNTNVYAAAVAGIHSDYADTHSPYFQDFSGGNGAISLLAEESPIYKIGGGAGVAVTVPLSTPGNTLVDSFNLSYFAGSANSPAKDNGLFNGRNSILAQVNFKPSDKFDFGLTYVHGEHKGGAIFDWGTGGGVVGSLLANGGTVNNVPLGGYNYSNSYGAAGSYKASENLILNGFVSLTSANGTTGGSNFNADILSYGVGAALPNVGQPGNLLGFFAGQSPSVTNANNIANNLSIAGTPFNNNSFHLESFYKYKLNDNISITPGLIYLTSPNQVKDSSALIGTVRTTFTF